MNYIESGEVQHREYNGGKNSYFLGKFSGPISCIGSQMTTNKILISLNNHSIGGMRSILYLLRIKFIYKILTKIAYLRAYRKSVIP